MNTRVVQLDEFFEATDSCNEVKKYIYSMARANGNQEYGHAEICSRMAELEMRKLNEKLKRLHAIFTKHT